MRDDQYAFVKNFVEQIEYDAYDKLIMICDGIAEAGGFCILEKRFIDTTMRYGFYDFSLDRWRKTYEYKEEFEKIIGRSLYSLLPGIENCIYR